MVNRDRVGPGRGADVGSRAWSEVEALQSRFGIAANRLEPYGVGPLAPVFSNGQATGKEKNRRVGLVER